MTGRAVFTGMFSVTHAFVRRSATNTTTATAATNARRRGLTRKSYWLGGDHSSVDDEHLAGDVAGLIRGQERDGVRDVLDRAEPPERDLLEEIVLDLLGERIGEIGGYESGGDRVRRDVPARHFARDGLREPDDPGLRRGVVRLTRIPHHARDRRDVHDPAGALFHHRPHHGPRDQECPSQIQIEDGIPLLGAHPQQEVVPGDAGVVHQDVEPTAAERQRGPNDVIGLTIERDVTLDKGRLAPGTLDESLGLFGSGGVALEVDRNVRAFAREAYGCGAPDPATAPGDERGPTLELHCGAEISRAAMRARRRIRRRGRSARRCGRRSPSSWTAPSLSVEPAPGSVRSRDRAPGPGSRS